MGKKPYIRNFEDLKIKLIQEIFTLRKQAEEVDYRLVDSIRYTAEGMSQVLTWITPNCGTCHGTGFAEWTCGEATKHDTCPQCKGTGKLSIEDSDHEEAMTSMYKKGE
jgi:DnaJ-class molecular chaperone